MANLFPEYPATEILPRPTLVQESAIAVRVLDAHAREGCSSLQSPSTGPVDNRSLWTTAHLPRDLGVVVARNADGVGKRAITTPRSAGLRVEVGVSGQVGERSEGGGITGQLELLLRAVALRIRLEVGHRLDLPVRLERTLGIPQPRRPARRPPRLGHPELTDDDRLGSLRSPLQERAHEASDRLEDGSGVHVDAGPVDLIIAGIEGRRITVDEPLG